MVKIILDCDRETVLKIADEKIKLFPNKKKVIQFDEYQDIEFCYGFAGEMELFYSCKLKFDGKSFCASQRDVEFVKLDKNLYFLKFLYKKVNFFQKKVKKISKNANIFNIFNNGLIEIETADNLIFSKFFNFQVVDADFLELDKGCFAIKLFGENQKDLSVVFNDNFEDEYCFDSSILERTENGFKVLTELYDIARHGFVEVFEIDNEIKKIDEYSVYLNGHSTNEFNDAVLPIYFLQSIRANDFVEAKKCLSEELLSIVKNEHLKSYFGNFSKVLIVGDKLYLAYQKQYYDGFGFLTQAKQVDFVIENNKICEMNIVE